ncbi:Lrp/AsnC family transcriptional regulator [Serratia rhizosphaerae]|uniref:Lrp/AsnC family transcriptional regulator n=1 Tax=unclassified Serratia (in: enterobacteria) TaxID=2647522 RepID=UPI000CF5E0FE|nr:MULTISPECIES: Lrp/AsnC family transcriptional regulator [unclassified Serratia (in: enterobacteria)]MBU3894209.1 Lrp/AsnC family transcriptional regulator [Serratia rubidaea]AVJ16832.1 AsnC family transcriptional regulator [Serratia sp. MYb239]MCA4823166.1 Lrp/AsnC family transcriptional regulator [Serratia rubidaea]QNK31244.1 Lrp/AsnC family transcriptional regulator [Serratia sp. JUb9]QPT14828.1 Lrp/AsnC family transcriptional regulator [Serratia rubidaea]
MDIIDHQILALLAEDARMSLKTLSAKVGLSSPSTSERLRRLEESGVIQGYTLNVNLQALGYSFQSLVRLKPLPGMLKKVEQMIAAIPEVVECDKVTGEDCFIVRLATRSLEQLDQILDRLAEQAQSNTSIVKTTPVKRRLPPLAV